MVMILRCTVCCVSVMVFVVAAAGATDPTDDLLLVLKEWEAATTDVRTPRPDNALAAYGDTHNAHELDAAAELLGPVVARRLVEEYRWTFERRDSGDIILHGVPRDATTSLFLSSVDVRLDGTAHRPVSIQFFAANGGPRPATIVVASSAASPSATHQADIQLVANTADVPDEPAPPRPLEMESILKRWQVAVGGIQNAEIQFRRYAYDQVFLSETRSKGRLLFNAPDLGVYEVEPIDPATDTQAARSDGRGGEYSLQTDRRTRYQWDGSRFWIIDLDLKRFDVVRIRETPPDEDVSGWNFLSYLKAPAFVVPGVVDVTDNFLNRFQWRLVREDDRGLMLDGTPISKWDRAEFKFLQVLIDRESFRTTATRVVSSTGRKETTHVFHYVSVNDNRDSRRSWVPDVSGLTNSSAYQDSDGEVED